ncbi:MAG TPA: hypothetical protein VFS20_08590 [Longimicrobium sp.]|nr:hypothetical protein [Longimicrobium sp.]
MKLELVRTLHAELATMPSIQVGPVTDGGVACEMYLMERENGERLQVDLYGGPEPDTCFATEVIEWGRWVAAGFGSRVYLVDPDTRDAREFRLPFYFDRFVAGEHRLLAVSGAGITRIDPDGRVEWENPSVAVDGVNIHDVEDGIISGSAEQDPPGGWQPFRVDLATGRSLPRGQSWPVGPESPVGTPPPYPPWDLATGGRLIDRCLGVVAELCRPWPVAVDLRVRYDWRRR